MDKRRAAFKLIAAGAFALSLAVGWSVTTARSRAIAIACIYGRLAPLPVSATNVFAAAYGNLFSANAFVKFKAPAADVERFLAASPGLRGVKGDRLTPKHMYAPCPLPGNDNLNDWTRARHFSPGQLPSRFDPAIRTAGRYFGVPQGRNADWAEVIIDDVSHTVFIRGGRS